MTFSVTGCKKKQIQDKAADTRNIHTSQQTESRESNARREGENSNKRATIPERVVPGTRIKRTEPQV